MSEEYLPPACECETPPTPSAPTWARRDNPGEATGKDTESEAVSAAIADQPGFSGDFIISSDNPTSSRNTGEGPTFTLPPGWAAVVSSAEAKLMISKPALCYAKVWVGLRTYTLSGGIPPTEMGDVTESDYATFEWTAADTTDCRNRYTEVSPGVFVPVYVEGDLYSLDVPADNSAKELFIQKYSYHPLYEPADLATSGWPPF